MFQISGTPDTFLLKTEPAAQHAARSVANSSRQMRMHDSARHCRLRGCHPSASSAIGDCCYPALRARSTGSSRTCRSRSRSSSHMHHAKTSKKISPTRRHTSQRGHRAVARASRASISSRSTSRRVPPCPRARRGRRTRPLRWQGRRGARRPCADSL